MFFSSTFDSNPFSSFPSSSNSKPPLPLLTDPQNDFASNHTLLHDPLAVPFTPTTHHYAPIPQTDTYYNAINGAHHGSNNIPNFLSTQKPKKDRHSKIYTSQGLRDRRVRLSNQIARKFFDLQDMLEFDKPSNTLEWLLTKSENAIKELARAKCSSCDTSEPRNVDTSGKSIASVSKGRKLKWVQREEDVCVVQTKKESREKARARARKRTCYKMCSNGRVQMQDLEGTCPVTANNTQILHHQNFAIIPEEASFNNNIDSYSFPYWTPNLDTDGAFC